MSNLGWIISLMILACTAQASDEACDYRMLAFRENNARQYGIVLPPFPDVPDSAIRLERALGLRGDIAMDDLLARATQARIAKFACDVKKNPARFEKDKAKLSRGMIESPISQPRQVVNVGLNYADHSEEVGIYDVIVFPKNIKVSGAYQTIPRPPGALLDWEVELGVVVRKKISPGTILTPENIAEYIAGFVIANDVTNRIPIILDTDQGYSRGKTHPGFLPIGPYFAPIESYPKNLQLNPRLAMELKVNDELKQNSNTEKMANPLTSLVPKILKEANTLWSNAEGKEMKLLPFGELLPGDVISTGTPSGTAIQAPKLGKKIGLGLKAILRAQSPRWVFINEEYCSGKYLRDSDQIQARIAGLGAQVNWVEEKDDDLEPRVACRSSTAVRNSLGITKKSL